MTRALRLCLILLLALTGVTLGHARGQTRVAGQVVLCAGGVLVTVTQPGEAPRQTICPDMALGLLAATLPALPIIIRPQHIVASAIAPHRLRAATAQVIVPQARGPPA